MIRKRMKFSKGADVTSRHMWYLECANIDCEPFDAFPSCQVYSRNENYLQDILTVTVEKYLQGDKERDFVEK